MSSEEALDALLKGSESVVRDFLSNNDLLHECICGYTVYDPDALNELVQSEYGSERCDEIHSWACSLSDKYGWLFLESSGPNDGMYFCQHCANPD